MRKDLSNLGQEFEMIIEIANNYYKERFIASIDKIPTPYKVERKYNAFKKTSDIVGAFPVKKSICDFLGFLRNGRAVAFEAKSTGHERNFALSMLKDHQRSYLERAHALNAHAFILIECKHIKKTFRLLYDDLERFEQEHERKSIPFEILEEYAKEVNVIEVNGQEILDYLGGF